MRGTRTPSGIIVTLLDLTPVCEAAVADINRQREQAESSQPRVESVSPNYRWGAVPTEQGVYCLCDEGVGHAVPVSEADPLEVDLWEDLTDHGYISIFPVCRAIIRPDELLTYVTEEAEPLAEFIRTFGSRLDANYEQWRQVLEQACVIA